MAENSAAGTAVLQSRHWMLAVAAEMASLLDSGAIISVGLGLALWKKAFDLDVWTVGVLGSALTLFIAVGSLTGGRLADLVGRGRMFSLTILLYAAAAVTVALAPSAPVLVTGVIVLGMAAGADLPTSLAVLSERAPEGTQGRLVAFTHDVGLSASVIATLLGFAVSGLGVPGISLIFGILAVLAVATFVFRSFLPAFRRPSRRRRSGTPPLAWTPTRPCRSEPCCATGLRSWLIALTALFYLLFTLVANTFGSFKTYFLVTVGGTTQTVATGLSFGTTLDASLARSCSPASRTRSGAAGSSPRAWWSSSPASS